MQSDGAQYRSFLFVIGGKTVYLDLADDEDLFQGTGDYQFDIYRTMKQTNG